MSHAACNFYIIAALCKLNKDDFESKIIMNRLFHFTNNIGPIAVIMNFYIFSKWNSLFIIILLSKSCLFNLHNAAIM